MEWEQHYIQVLLLFTTKMKSAFFMQAVTNSVYAQFPKPRVKWIILTSVFFYFIFCMVNLWIFDEMSREAKRFFVSDHYQIPTTLQKKKKLS